MKIAILYICTGKYFIFWENFYRSMEKYFLPVAIKHYFVFTDQNVRLFNDRVHLIYQKHLGWPFDTLLRFHMFHEIKEQLLQFDFIFFLNANMLCVAPINEEILPKEEQLVALLHPGFHTKDRKFFTYENDPASLAFIPKNKGKYYFMGAFNGGKSKAYLKLIETLAYRIEKDLSKNIIAIWHDESHLNRYLLHKRVKKISPSYGYPQDWDLGFDPKIIILDKNKLGGHDFIRSGTYCDKQ